MMNRKDRRAAAKHAKKQLNKRSDVAVDPKQVLAESVQDAIQEAIQKVGVSPNDIPTIVHALGMTAAGLACSVGVSTKEFTDKMQLYMTQVRQAVGMPPEVEPEDEGPTLILQ